MSDLTALFDFNTVNAPGRVAAEYCLTRLIYTAGPLSRQPPRDFGPPLCELRRSGTLHLRTH